MAKRAGAFGFRRIFFRIRSPHENTRLSGKPQMRKSEIHDPGKFLQRAEKFQAAISECRSILGHDFPAIVREFHFLKAYLYLFHRAEEKEISIDDMLRAHELLVGTLENNAIPGKFRDKNARIGSSVVFPPPEKVREMTEELFADFQEKRGAIQPVVAAADFHASLVRIHPFADGNGRISRMMMNTVLVQEEWLPVTILRDHRMEYCESLMEYDKNPDRFRNFVLYLETESQMDFLRFIRPYMRERGSGPASEMSRPQYP